MATRSLTRFVDSDNRAIVCMYRHWDGRPESHGAELAKLLAPCRAAMGRVDGQWHAFNGIECLAASVVAHFKTTNVGKPRTARPNAGGFYLYHPDTIDVGEEYVYVVRVDSEGYPVISVETPSPKAHEFYAERAKDWNVDACKVCEEQAFSPQI